MKPIIALILPTTSLTHAADIPITLTKPGNVSAPIYDAQGCMVHELVHAETMQMPANSP